MFVCDVSIVDIMVMNTKYGSLEILPFDLRAKGISTYTVAEVDEEKAPERNNLSRLFVAALNIVFENHGHGPRTPNDVKPMASELKTMRQVDAGAVIGKGNGYINNYFSVCIPK